MDDSVDFQTQKGLISVNLLLFLQVNSTEKPQMKITYLNTQFEHDRTELLRVPL